MIGRLILGQAGLQWRQPRQMSAWSCRSSSARRLTSTRQAGAVGRGARRWWPLAPAGVGPRSASAPPANTKSGPAPCAAAAPQIPPATTVGHRADTWNVNKWLCEVAVRVVTADEDCFVRLEDCKSGALKKGLCGSGPRPHQWCTLVQAALCGGLLALLLALDLLHKVCAPSPHPHSAGAGLQGSSLRSAPCRPMRHWSR